MNPQPIRSTMYKLGYGDALRDGVTEALHRTRDRCGLGESRTVAIPDTSPARGAAPLCRLRLTRLGAAHRVTLGSTSDRLIHHAPCPVLVIPHTTIVTEASTLSEATAATS